MPAKPEAHLTWHVEFTTSDVHIELALTRLSTWAGQERTAEGKDERRERKEIITNN